MSFNYNSTATAGSAASVDSTVDSSVTSGKYPWTGGLGAKLSVTLAQYTPTSEYIWPFKSKDLFCNQPGFGGCNEEDFKPEPKGSKREYSSSHLEAIKEEIRKRRLGMPYMQKLEFPKYKYVFCDRVCNMGGAVHVDEFDVNDYSEVCRKHRNKLLPDGSAILKSPLLEITHAKYHYVCPLAFDIAVKNTGMEVPPPSAFRHALKCIADVNYDLVGKPWWELNFGMKAAVESPGVSIPKTVAFPTPTSMEKSKPAAAFVFTTPAEDVKTTGHRRNNTFTFGSSPTDGSSKNVFSAAVAATPLMSNKASKDDLDTPPNVDRAAYWKGVASVQKPLLKQLGESTKSLEASKRFLEETNRDLQADMRKKDETHAVQQDSMLEQMRELHINHASERKNLTDIIGKKDDTHAAQMRELLDQQASERKNLADIIGKKDDTHAAQMRELVDNQASERKDQAEIMKETTKAFSEAMAQLSQQGRPHNFVNTAADEVPYIVPVATNSTEEAEERAASITLPNGGGTLEIGEFVTFKGKEYEVKKFLDDGRIGIWNKTRGFKMVARSNVTKSS